MVDDVLVPYLSYQSCVSKRRPDFSAQVELLILYYIYEKDKRGSVIFLKFVWSNIRLVVCSTTQQIAKHAYLIPYKRSKKNKYLISIYNSLVTWLLLI